MMTRGAGLILLVAAIVLAPVSAYADSWGIDISYDKCGSSLGQYDHGMVGVNGGGDWERNTCLGSEIKHFDNYFLYVNTNYPSDSCHEPVSRKAAYHCGYNLGRWDVDYANGQGAHSNVWFLDVEEGRGIPWSGNDSWNSAFLYGLGKGIQSETNALIGYYSTPSMWSDITGDWNSGGMGWYATGSIGKPSNGTIDDACKSAFNGGNYGVTVYQYIVGDFDHDDLC